MAESYGKLHAYDARQLGVMIGQLSSDRSRVNRALLALHCFSQLIDNGRPCPYFRVGIRTMSRECGTSVGAARKFVERAEESGWIVCLSPDEHGKYVKRTFSWIAEEAADGAGMDVEDWLEKVVGVHRKVHRGVHQPVHTVVHQDQQIGAHQCAPTLAEAQVEPPVFEGRYTQQSTEYSERGGVARPSSEVGPGTPIVLGNGMVLPPRPEGWS